MDENLYRIMAGMETELLLRENDRVQEELDRLMDKQTVIIRVLGERAIEN